MRHIDEIKARIPDAAKDLRVNLGNVFRSESLTERQVWGTALVSAIASRHDALTAAVAADAAEHLDATAREAATTAAALMAMNNVYYRFVHLSSNEVYGSLPANLRMQGIASHGVDNADFELWSIAVSAIHGCGMCIDSHENKLVGEGVKPEAVRDAIRIASVVHAVAVTLQAAAAVETSAASV